MLDDAALALEEIEPGEKIRSGVLGVRVAIYLAAEKWDMAAAVANHLVKVSLSSAGGSTPMRSDAAGALVPKRCSGRELHHDQHDQNLTLHAIPVAGRSEAKRRSNAPSN